MERNMEKPNLSLKLIDFIPIGGIVSYANRMYHKPEEKFSIKSTLEIVASSVIMTFYHGVVGGDILRMSRGDHSLVYSLLKEFFK